MTSQFHVDTERIAAASGEVHRISVELENQVSRMMSQLTGLQDAWRGTAATQFHHVMQEWQTTQAKVREALDHIGRTLGQAGQQYAAAEQQTTAMFR
ncbi:MAG: WXG100 family type VII secretion target [Actinomycetota bacterium]